MTKIEDSLSFGELNKGKKEVGQASQRGSTIEDPRRYSIGDGLFAGESSDGRKEPAYAFNVVGSNLVWLNTKDQEVVYLDLNAGFKDYNQGELGSPQVNWKLLGCKGFQV